MADQFQYDHSGMRKELEDLGLKVGHSNAKGVIEILDGVISEEALREIKEKYKSVDEKGDPVPVPLPLEMEVSIIDLVVLKLSDRWSGLNSEQKAWIENKISMHAESIEKLVKAKI